MYQPTWESIATHRVPGWYEDAKLGVFLHWGLYSVPGWAPQVPDIQTILREHKPSWLLRNIPYAEWYLNTLALADSPTRRHHEAIYGADFPYEGFAPMFDEASADADLDALASLCRSAGATYVVLTSKHADGYCLWPTGVPHPVKGAYHASRDLVGELTEAVRSQGMRMGLYYSGGYDWPFNGAVVSRLADVALAVPADEAYARYAEAHVAELIERYRPSVLWNDIAWPARSRLPAVFARYYNAVEDGVVNDRWLQSRRHPAGDAALRAAGAAIERLWPLIPSRYKKLVIPPSRHADFNTSEYASYDTIVDRKWEATRGVGHSFGANRNEAPQDLLSATELVRLLVDVVAKNGNLLIGIGPLPDGSIAEEQAAPLVGLGNWLAVNGEAIYGTRPWSVATDTTTDATPARYTQDGRALYATLLGTPGTTQLRFRALAVNGDGEADLRVHLLGVDGALDHQVVNGALSVVLPERLPVSAAHVVQIAPLAACRFLLEPA